MTERSCTIDGCTDEVRSRGWCRWHYMQWFRTGDPLTPRKYESRGKAMQWVLDHYLDPDAHDNWPYRIGSTGYAKAGGRSIHSIVAELVHGPAPEGMIAAHSCRNRHCFYAEHVSWKTQSENCREDKERDGTAMQGEKHHRAKLTEDRVREIRASSLSQRALARKYGVTRWTIKGILQGTAWKHVE